MFIQGEKFAKVADNKNIFYRNTPDVNELFRNPPKNKFVLVSHNSDGKITQNPKKYDADVNLMPDNLIKWYGQNVNYVDERIESIPIGLENSKWFPHIRKKEKMTNILEEDKKIKNLLYVNHNIGTNIQERKKPYELLANKSWCTLEMGLNGSNFDNYLNNIFNHKFVLCPEGNGQDTHRTWECLYLETIPIEKRNINNQFYTDLPICFVDKWEDITEDFLNNEYDRINRMVWNYDKLEMSYWIEKIRNNYV